MQRGRPVGGRGYTGASLDRTPPGLDHGSLACMYYVLPVRPAALAWAGPRTHARSDPFRRHLETDGRSSVTTHHNATQRTATPSS
jgi:hypothetical protein